MKGKKNAAKSKFPQSRIILISYPSTVYQLLQALKHQSANKGDFRFPPKTRCSGTKNTISQVSGTAMREHTSTSTFLTLGYGYCFALGYSAPVNRGITTLGTSESFIIRKASLSPSGDHQCAMWECRSSSRINECYLKPTVEMWAQWPTNICPRYLHGAYIFSIQCVGLYWLCRKVSIFWVTLSTPGKADAKEGRKQWSQDFMDCQ